MLTSKHLTEAFLAASTLDVESLLDEEIASLTTFLKSSRADIVAPALRGAYYHLCQAAV